MLLANETNDATWGNGLDNQGNGLDNQGNENQSERQHFKNHRAWSLVAAKRVGIVLGRKNLFEFLWRMFSAQDLKFLWSFLTVPQAIRIAMIAPESVRAIPAADIAMNGLALDHEAMQFL